ncbi:MAG: LacI family transcriptional regulator [Ignavibacteriae bacterium]|nr:LacI family transcriptional regulator [Ignavibacteriota bacterium]
MSKNKKPIILNDIAKKLNVSTVTVSKALRDHPDISELLTDKIKKTAEKLGYFPNFAARNLSSKKTNTIGVIVPVIANYFFANIVESIYECAFENNFDIILAVSQEDSQKERKHLETMLSMRVDGIIISASEHSENEDIFKRINKMKMPIVFFDRTINNSDYSSVTLANKEGAFKAVEKIIENGYKKIGHIGGWQDSNIGRDRYAGFKQAMRKHKLSINKVAVIFSGFGKEDGYNSFMKMYNENNLPDFLFAITFPVGLGIVEAANEVGLKIPKDLDLICFGDSDLNDYLKPSISCVTHNISDFATQAFRLVLEQIDTKKNFIVKHLEIETELVLKDTCIIKK